MVRLHPEALRRLQARADFQRGRKSGVASVIRQIIYKELGFSSSEWDAVNGEEGLGDDEGS